MAVHRRFLLAQACASALAFVCNERAAAQTVNYTYDELGRIKTATYSNGATITYTYDAAGNRTQVVQVAGTPAPTGTFSASPASISSGGSSTLTWTSSNATSASIDNGVGAVTPVAGGSVSVSPSSTTTYTLTLTGAGGQIQLQTTVAVTAFTQTIQITGTGPVNLRTLANAAGYNGAQDATIVFQVGSGVTITGAAGAPDGGVAIDTGTWPTSSYAINLTLQVLNGGKVYGGGGRGGLAPTTPGGLGGDAVYARCNLAISVASGGQIKAGGGGGGPGASWDKYVLDTETQTWIYDHTLLGGGGGGGFPNGPTNGSTSGGGAGSAGATESSHTSGTGGNGGGAATAGVTGGNGTGTTTNAWRPVGGLVAGAAGWAIRKNGNTVTVTNSGTITGTVG